MWSTKAVFALRISAKIGASFVTELRVFLRLGQERYISLTDKALQIK